MKVLNISTSYLLHQYRSSNWCSLANQQ